MPAISRIEGSRISFVDGRQVDVDLILLATGYIQKFPFLHGAKESMQNGISVAYVAFMHIEGVSFTFWFIGYLPAVFAPVLPILVTFVWF